MKEKSRKVALELMLKAEPNDIFLNYALAMELMSEKDYLNADMQLKKTLELNKEYLPCYYQLGQVNERLNKINDAIQFYQNGIVLAKKTFNTKALNELKEALWLIED